MTITLHESLEDLEHRANLKAYALIRDRLLAVILAARRHSAPEIARRLCRSDRWVQKWVYRYRDQGLAGLAHRPRSGQPPKLKPDRQAAFRQRIEAGTQPQDGTCRLAGREIRRILNQEFGAHYTLNGTYRLLHRLGYACLRPRPKHRKSDPAAQEAFKQALPLLSGR